jgi:ubiquinone biosynthesis monooxygenase Coq7
LIKKLVVISSNYRVKGKGNLGFVCNHAATCGFETTDFCHIHNTFIVERLPMDGLIIRLDRALRVVSGVASAARQTPAARLPDSDLTDAERRRSAGLMRVNHVGEVCAQALYAAQGQLSSDPGTRAQFREAAREEEDHLAWTAQRLEELNSHTSVLNPVWYAGAYAMGAMAARLGDAHSLGFVVETERQVEAHLASHLERLPANDLKSRAVVEQMRQDEVAHGAAAQALGAAEMPPIARKAMRAMSKVMTGLAYYI